jgi:hypothetical protein
MSGLRPVARDRRGPRPVPRDRLLKTVLSHLRWEASGSGLRNRRPGAARMSDLCTLKVARRRSIDQVNNQREPSVTERPCVDVFGFKLGSDRIDSMHIVYDTHLHRSNGLNSW